jgi:hypothetical protein
MKNTQKRFMLKPDPETLARLHAIVDARENTDWHDVVLEIIKIGIEAYIADLRAGHIIEEAQVNEEESNE